MYMNEATPLKGLQFEPYKKKTVLKNVENSKKIKFNSGLLENLVKTSFYHFIVG